LYFKIAKYIIQISFDYLEISGELGYEYITKHKSFEGYYLDQNGLDSRAQPRGLYKMHQTGNNKK